MQADRIAVVIPAYNEAGTIRKIVEGALAVCSEIIVVDDGSTDGTSAQIEDLPVVLVRHASNLGKAAAFWKGSQVAIDRGATVLVTLDGDGQHRPGDIARFIEQYKCHPGQIVLGSRLARREDFPPERYRAVTIADFWISWAAGKKIEDSQCGFRLYPISLFSKIKIRHDRSRSFVYESEILIEAVRRGYSIESVGIDAIYQDSARPSHFRPVLDIVRITRMVSWKLVSRGFYPVGLYRAFWEPVKKRASSRGLERDGFATLVLSNFVLIATGGLYWLYCLLRVTYTAISTSCHVDHEGWLLVLGKRLKNGSVDEEYARRLQRAQTLWRNKPKIPILLLGGAADSSSETEAAAGKEYLERIGVHGQSLILEDLSPHTLENLRRARTILASNTQQSPVLITNRYHLGRSLIFAQSIGLKPILCAAEEKFQIRFGEILRLMREAYYVHWFEIGRSYAKLSGNAKMLERLT